MFGLRPLVVTVQYWWYGFLMSTAHPLCPDYPKWVIKRRSIVTPQWRRISTGPWY
jgi:hypothetical protein